MVVMAGNDKDDPGEIPLLIDPIRSIRERCGKIRVPSRARVGSVR